MRGVLTLTYLMIDLLALSLLLYAVELLDGTLGFLTNFNR